MHVLNIKMDEAQYEALRALAFKERCSIASLVRDAVKDLLDAATLDDLPKE